MRAKHSQKVDNIIDADKEGARKEQPDNPCSFNTLRRIMKGESREEWLRRWRDGDTGRVMYREMQEPNPKDDINSLP